MLVLTHQRGSIVILSLFGIFFLIGIMALFVNAGFLISNKIQIQNAVDSSAYSGAVVQARGLNLLSALNQSLQRIITTYQNLLILWNGALLADQGKPEGPAQKSWRLLFQEKLTVLCDPSSLRKISCEQSRIVSQFNPSYSNPLCSGNLRVFNKNIVATESALIGQENVQPIPVMTMNSQDFSPWAMNFHQGGKMPGLSVELKPETSSHLTGAGANSLSKGIRCDVPAQWGLKQDYEKTQYVLSSATTHENQALFFQSYFGSKDKLYAIAKAKPVRKSSHMQDLHSMELNATDWEGRLVPVDHSPDDEEIFQKFRKSVEGKALGFQQVPTRPLLH